jgi:amidase
VRALHYRTATELVRALRAREVSSAELLEHLVERQERVNPRINAIVARGLDAARERAAAADVALTRGGDASPALLGLPMTVKDSIEVVGMPTTSGAASLAEHFPARNADAVERLVDAGAVIFGKTNLPLFAGDFQSYNEVYGTTNNPWDPARVPGGSSGGSAAALAAGMTPLELGSDIGGSIRGPAHFCGVYGHKPTLGIVSGRGHIPGPPGALAPADLAVIGPLARAPEDLELALGVLAGPRPEDAAAWRVELPPPRRTRLADFRVAVWLAEPAGPPVAGEVSELLARAVDRVAAAGARVDDAARPPLDPAVSHRLYLRLLYGVVGAGFPPELLRGFEAALPGLPPDDHGTFAEMVRGSVGPHRQWLADDEARWRLRAAWAEWFRDFDVLVCPVAPLAAFPHDHVPFESRSLDVDGRAIPYTDLVFWAGLATLVGLPATAVPVGRTPSGLPVGMQVIAARLEDRTGLAFAKALEDVVGGFVPPPGLAD